MVSSKYNPDPVGMSENVIDLYINIQWDTPMYFAGSIYSFPDNFVFMW